MGFFTVVGIIVCCIAGIAAAVATCVLTYCFVKEPLTSFAERLKRRFGGRPRVSVELWDDDEGD